MPISVNQLIQSAGLNYKRARNVKWGNSIESSSLGIYIISTTIDPEAITPVFETAPIDTNLLDFWITRAPKMQIDNQPATSDALLKKLESFWLPDETILYVDFTTNQKGLSQIMSKVYNTRLGDGKPTTSGYWLKTLSIMDKLHVHYISCSHPRESCEEMLKNFKLQISKKTKKGSNSPKFLSPFANRKVGLGATKIVGITNYYDLPKED